MKNIRMLLILTILLCISSINYVYADCNSEELQKYKDMADNIRISYQYIENDNSESYDEKNLFSFTVSNIPQELKVFESTLSYMFQNNDSEQFSSITKDNFSGGSNLKFIFYTTDSTNCPNQKIKVTSVDLPVYNEFSTDELCEGIEDFKYCHKTIDNKITYEGFKKNVLEYRQNLNNINNDETIQETNNNTNFESIKRIFFEKPIIPILSILLFITIIIIVIYNKKRSKIV